MEHEFIISLNADTGEVPEWLEMVPKGRIQGRDGRVFHNTRPDDVVQTFRERGVMIPFDMEHATEKKAPNGDPAPAAGWIEAMENRGGAVWGKVAWNTQTKEMIKNKEYRYYSPVFLHTSKTNEVVRLLSAGLTNRPNLMVRALCTEEPTTKGDPMDFLKKVNQAAGLPDTATEDEAITKIKALNSELQLALNREHTPDLMKFVPRGDYDALSARALNAEQALSEEKKRQFGAKADQVIEQAVAEGKITPATKDFYKRMCNSEEGLSSFTEFVKAAPVVTPPSSLDGKKPEGSTAMNAEMTAISGIFGNSMEDLKKHGGLN